MTQGTERALVVLGTLDTKLAEVIFLREQLLDDGWPVRVVDVGLEGGSETADVTAEQVAAHAGSDLTKLRRTGRRDSAMAAMARGAARQLRQWHEEGGLAGVLAVGGNQGTSIAATAMRELPLGLPKLIVSTVASGDVRGHIGDSDITLMFSIGDLLGGPNEVTGQVLRRAAAAMGGMATAESAHEPGPASADLDHDQPLRVAITAFGNTHPAVVTAMARLAGAGVSTVPFHASGACGSAMERLISEGMFSGVLDLTTHELLGELYPADIYAPVRPGRLTAAGKRGLPQVIAPGGLEYHCFAAPDTIPEHLRSRPTHHHNPNNTNVRTTADELIEVARAMADRLNASTGPVIVLIPLNGWSQVGSPGGILHDPAANHAFVDTLRNSLAEQVALRELDLTINDPEFAAEAVDTLLELLPPQRGGLVTSATSGT